MKSLRVSAAALLMLSAAPAALAQSADAELEALIEDVEAFDEAENPIQAGREGDMDALAEMPRVTPEAEARRLEAYEGFAGRIDEIQRSDLSQDGKLNYDLLEWMVDWRVERAAFDENRIPFTNDSGFHTNLAFIADSTSIETMAEAEAYAARLNDYPRYIEENIANLERAIQTGWTQPEMIAERILDGAEAQVPGQDIEASVYYSPVKDLPDTMSADEKREARQRVTLAINESVRPAALQLVEFLENEYVPAARETLGAREMERGEDWYPVLVRYYTTTDMTPDEVHELGLKEVERIRGEMEAVIEEAGFDGTFQEFLDFLRTDDQFYAETPEELLSHASRIAKTIDGKLPQYFSLLPRNSYGVRAVPDDIAPNYTTGRYWGGDLEEGRAGFYMVNTYNLDQRPLYNLPALTLHEAVPGHHLQIALAQEQEDVPEFRQELYPNAFGEGWGLYAEKLGEEMGIYTTPYEKFGRLSYEMWRACRLVVDTGIHWKGWTRDQAEACFLENSALAEHNIRTEVDRYISWPGQALAYKLGELKIIELRERAEDALGADFDIREYHRAVLENGAVPLSILEEQIDRWIEEQQADAE